MNKYFVLVSTNLCGRDFFLVTNLFFLVIWWVVFAFYLQDLWVCDNSINQCRRKTKVF